MRNYKSKLIILVIFCIALVGCKNGEKNEKNNDSVKIGVVLSLSGNGAVPGDYTLKGIQLAVKQQNAKGGLLGKQIELDIQDSKGEPKTGVSIVKRMLDNDNAPAIICSNTSQVSLAIKPLTESNEIILVGSAAADQLTEGSKFVMRNFVESNKISERITDYVINEKNLNSLGVFYVNNDFGLSILNKLKLYANQKELKIDFSKDYQMQSSDFKSVISSTELKNTSAIYVIGVGKTLGTFIKQIREAGFEGLIISDPLFNNPDTIGSAGTAATGVNYLDFAFSQESSLKEASLFSQNYREDFNSEPKNIAAITYDAMLLLFKSIESAKTMNPSAIMEASESLEVKGANGVIKLTDGNIDYPTIFKVN